MTAGAIIGLAKDLVSTVAAMGGTYWGLTWIEGEAGAAAAAIAFLLLLTLAFLAARRAARAL